MIYFAVGLIFGGFAGFVLGIVVGLFLSCYGPE